MSLYIASERQKEREPRCQRAIHVHPLVLPSLSREAAPHGSSSCNPPILPLATNALFSSCFLSESLSQFPSRMQSLSLPLHSRLKAMTDAGGEPEGEGSYLMGSTEAVGKKGTPTALGRGWAGVRSLTQGTWADDGEGNRRRSQGYRSWQLCPQKPPSRWLHYASSLLLIASSPSHCPLQPPAPAGSFPKPSCPLPTVLHPTCEPTLPAGNAAMPSAGSGFGRSITSLRNLFIAVKNGHLNF